MQLSLKHKVFGLYVVVLLGGIVLSGIVHWQGRSAIEATQQLVDRDIPTLRTLSDLKADVAALEPIVYQYYVSLDRPGFLARRDANEASVARELQVIRGVFPADARLAEIEREYGPIKAMVGRLGDVLAATPIDHDQARFLLIGISNLCMRINGNVDQLAESIHRDVAARGAEAQRIIDGIARLVIFFSAFLFVVTLLGAYYARGYLAEGERLVHLAYHDPLTGLPNRRCFLERLRAATAPPDARPTAVLLLNLDRFRQVTESLGPAVGDQLLVGVARRLDGLLARAGDAAGEAPGEASLYRLDGELFAILLGSGAASGRPSAASDLAVRIAAAMEAPLAIDGRELFGTFSIGVAGFPDHGVSGEPAEALVKNAESALHRVIGDGGNAYQCYSQEMNARAVDRLELEAALRQALAQGRLAVHYQPQVDLASGRLVGVEALARWVDPVRGNVSPAEFIPLAEESGLIVALGEWVLHAACAQNQAWQAAGWPPLTVAVNISARQFRGGQLPVLVRRVLETTGLPPQYLELEVTESVAMHDVESTIATLQALKAIGVGLSIDDFGTGYSSLAYLKRFPVDKLKVDQSFVRHMETDANDAAIANSVIALGHSLQLRVIAEGVENERQLAMLRDYGCEEAQGFLIGRPLPAAAVAVQFAQGAVLAAG